MSWIRQFIVISVGLEFHLFIDNWFVVVLWFEDYLTLFLFILGLIEIFTFFEKLVVWNLISGIGLPICNLSSASIFPTFIDFRSVSFHVKIRILFNIPNIGQFIYI